jgi:hypothetical protein
MLLQKHPGLFQKFYNENDDGYAETRIRISSLHLQEMPQE